MSKYLVKVLVSRESLLINQEFTYLSHSYINKYNRVQVSFGNQRLIGIVIECEIYSNQQFDYKLKDIDDVIDENPLINDELYHLALYMQKQYLVSKMAAINTMLPPGLKTKDIKESSKELYLVYQESNNQLRESTIEAKEYLEKSKHVLHSEFVKLFSVSKVNTLIKNGYAYKEKRDKKYALIDENLSLLKEMTPKQEQAYEKIINSNQTTSLLHGVTGSGKTEVFLHLAKHYLDQGQSVLILVPEITLTLMMMKRFASIFNNDIAIIHSKLSNSAKYYEYKRIANNEVKLVVGTRSAVFAPLDNIGIIILDEEHDSSYKQENNVMYLTHDIAIERANYYKGKVLLASATPSIISYTKAQKGLYNYVYLDSRFNNKDLPKLELVDLNYEDLSKAVSETSINTIQEFLDLKKQVIVLINRRGYHNFFQCRDCHEIIKCPSCEIPLTYHKKQNELVCHHCYYRVVNDETCPYCHSHSLKRIGVGSQKIEEYLQSHFHSYVVDRLDIDATKNVATLESSLLSFEQGKTDILVGTQMIAKGLDFSNADLVVVLNIDSSLFFSFYDANEKAFQLLVQVSGRAGRHSGQGKVLIETFNKDNEIVKSAITHNYHEFYQYEIVNRRAYSNPPFYYQARITITSDKLEIVDTCIDEIEGLLNIHYNKMLDIQVLKDFSSILKINNRYQKSILLKYKDYELVVKALYKLKTIYLKKKNVSISIDTHY